MVARKQINVYVEDEKEIILIDKAAKKNKRSRSQYMINASIKEAERDLKNE